MVVGSIVGFTMSVQRALFTELPIAYEFPTIIFTSILVLSLICAFFGSFLAIKNITKHEISDIIRFVN